MNLIFDFNGTLVDSIDQSINIINSILQEYDYRPVTKVQIRNEGIKNIIRNRNIPIFRLSLILFKARMRMSKSIVSLKPTPGLSEIIPLLAKKHTLGIVSSNSHKDISKFLKQNDIACYFYFIADEKNYLGKDGRLSQVIKKYNLGKKKTYYIGDESRDVEAAKKAGIKSIAVTWGFESEKVIRASSPDLMVRNLRELLSFTK